MGVIPIYKKKNVIVIAGAQWGDEGKGKLVDLLASHFDIVARYQGGHNAGHTVCLYEEEFVLHLVPSGILNQNTQCVIGNGVVLNPHAFLDEVLKLEERGVDTKGRLYVSDRCHLIFPYHEALDRVREERLGKEAIGTTLRGIGPAYEDKASRKGIRAGETHNLPALRERILYNLKEANLELVALGADPVEADSFLGDLMAAAEQLAPYVCDTSLLLNKAIDDLRSVLLEGAQAGMLDVDHGSYPFVTSSNPNLGGAITGTGISPFLFTGALAIVKAYTTRVGGGAFATELVHDIGPYLQQTGHEVGASTGRPRRCGWFDAPVVRHSQMLNRFSAMALMKLDVLDMLPEIKICTTYEGFDGMPSNWADLVNCKPIYETVPGWMTSTSDIRSFNGLPPQARYYVRRLEKLCGMQAAIISVGPRRDQTIIRDNSVIQKWFG